MRKLVEYYYAGYALCAAAIIAALFIQGCQTIQPFTATKLPPLPTLTPTGSQMGNSSAKSTLVVSPQIVTLAADFAAANGLQLTAFFDVKANFTGAWTRVGEVPLPANQAGTVMVPYTNNGNFAFRAGYYFQVAVVGP